MLRFRHTTSPGPVVDHLVVTLTRELDTGKRVLWLVPGGSGVTVAVAVAAGLRAKSYPNLVVSLTDERYGEPGHPDSNWQALEAAGFALRDAVLLPVLVPDLGLEATAGRFGRTLESRLAAADYALGLFGLGADGHTAGILPHSPAVDAAGMAAGYDGRPLGSPFQRVTATPAAIARLDEAVVFATGRDKWSQLDALATDRPLSDQPAQVLKQVHQVTVYNDHRGDAA